MTPTNEYRKASRYNLDAQRHNRRVFHGVLVAHPWHALALAVSMSLLAVTAGFNLVDSPRWIRHPWMGWLLGGIAAVPAAYFFVCALRGWRTRAPRSDSGRSGSGSV